MTNVLSPCPLIRDIKYQSNKKDSYSNRRSTESWLNDLIEEYDIKFRYFITLSFYRKQRDEIQQYIDNHHIKNVILSYFYPNRKPKNRIRIWFFPEKHQDESLHLHMLMEGMDGLTWLMKNNRKITLSKRTLFDIIAADYSIDDVITEGLTNHLQSYILKLGTSKQSVDIRSVRDIKKRVHYLNKSLDSINFDKWQHIDYENSDLPRRKN